MSTIDLNHYLVQLQVSTLKVAAKSSFRGQKSYENLDVLGTFLKQKQRSVTKKIETSAIDLASLSSGTHFLEVGARVSLNVATKVIFRGKKTLKIEIFKLLFKAKNG